MLKNLIGCFFEGNIKLRKPQMASRWSCFYYVAWYVCCLKGSAEGDKNPRKDLFCFVGTSSSVTHPGTW